MKKFPHIGSLKHAIQYAAKCNTSIDPSHAVSTVVYTGTVKLHGTNAGVYIEDGGATFQPQSRNRVLSVDNDNLGFAKFITDPDRQSALMELVDDILCSNMIPRDTPITVFGEFIGPGIQQKVAITKLPERQFVVFGVAVGENQDRFINGKSLPQSSGQLGILSITDVPVWEEVVDFRDQDSVDSFAECVTNYTTRVDENCPWGAKFGIDGHGEGIVWTPDNGNENLYFKSKGGSHNSDLQKTNVTTSKISSADPRVQDFVRKVVTESRLQQGYDYLVEMGMAVDKTSTGKFLSWVGQDVQRECEIDLQESGLVWKDVAKLVNATAAQWYAAKV